MARVHSSSCRLGVELQTRGPDLDIKQENNRAAVEYLGQMCCEYGDLQNVLQMWNRPIEIRQLLSGEIECYAINLNAVAMRPMVPPGKNRAQMVVESA
ncbi:hypothetical protein KEM54_005578 [Ascosphaera aggregata]|nr:hypothetical protein KEM54_005578 [Ascosphaera aggregata]